MKKKGVSPVIATVILIAIVVILAVIIFLWARGFTAEGAVKNGKAVEFSCDQNRLSFRAGLFLEDGGDCSLEIVNDGEIGIYGFQLKDLSSEGSVIVTDTLQGIENSVGSGDSKNIFVEGCSYDIENDVLVVPIILGETSGGNVPYICPDGSGFSVTVT